MGLLALLCLGPFGPSVLILLGQFVLIGPINVCVNAKMDSTVKSLTITGTAAEDATRFRQKGSRRKRIIKEAEPEPQGETDDQFIEQVKKISLVKSSTPVIQPTQLVQIKPAPLQTQQPSMQPSVQAPQQNVILKPLRQPRVKLQPKSTPIPSGHSDTTRKARRIHLSVGNLTHRFTRAKRVKDDTEKKPMSSIREYLVGKGVIQQKSKAPEKMLRSMYSDFMLLKDQAL